MSDEIYVSFGGQLIIDGELIDVRLTVNVKDIDIISRDHVDSYDVKEHFLKLENLYSEDIYDG